MDHTTGALGDAQLRMPGWSGHTMTRHRRKDGGRRVLGIALQQRPQGCAQLIMRIRVINHVTPEDEIKWAGRKRVLRAPSELLDDHAARSSELRTIVRQVPRHEAQEACVAIRERHSVS